MLESVTSTGLEIWKLGESIRALLLPLVVLGGKIPESLWVLVSLPIRFCIWMDNMEI